MDRATGGRSSRRPATRRRAARGSEATSPTGQLDVHPARRGAGCKEVPCRASGVGPKARPVKIWRVERRDTFSALRQARRRQKGPLTVSWVAGDPAEPPRVAFIVGRRIGSAVVRNRLRRRLRSIMREAAPQLLPGAYLVGAAPDAARMPYAHLRALLLEALNNMEEP